MRSFLQYAERKIGGDTDASAYAVAVLAGETKAPPIFHHYLSVIYFKLNDTPKALEHAEAYRRIHREEHDIAEWDRQIQLITRRGSA